MNAVLRLLMPAITVAISVFAPPLWAQELKVEASQPTKKYIAAIDSLRREPDRANALADAIKSERVDVPMLVTAYAAEKIGEAGLQLERPPFSKSPEGERLFNPDDSLREALKKISQATRSRGGEKEFRMALEKEELPKVLVKLSENYSVQAIKERSAKGSEDWSWPLCVPNCK